MMALLEEWEIDEDHERLAAAIAEVVVALFEVRDDSLYDAVVRSVAFARVDNALSERDEALIVAAAMTARKIDVQDDYFAALERDAVEHGRRPPNQDNVSLPTLLKYLGELRLTPASRAPKPPKGVAPGAGVIEFRQRNRQRRTG